MEFIYEPGDVDPTRPLIDLWDIDGALYVGKARRGAQRPRTQYLRNVQNLLAGRPYRKGKPEAYRRVHVALAEAVCAEGPITLRLLRNVEVHELNAVERELILAYGCTLNGG